MLNIPIVIAAYNRRDPLQRLLASLQKALYPSDVKLIISVDGGVDNSDVVELANKFDWRHGEKQVITSEKNMGLRNHILKCGRLANEYDGIILFEDDLYVSPHFYEYVLQSHDYYQDEENITGIALYSHQYNETACLPFRAIEDGTDVFFMQVACSWGQSWLKHQWQAFEEWYKKNHDLDLSEDIDIPPDVRLWPATSWKKYYLKYMVENNKYYVYPRVSLVTNFADPGVHHNGTNIHQVPLLYNNKDYVFSRPGDSVSRYDVYCEIIPEVLSSLVTELDGYDYSVDLYGMKNKNDITSKYVLTTQKLSKYERSYGRRLKPHELNVCEFISGDEIFFGLRKKMSDYGVFVKYRNLLNQDYENTHNYFYSITKQHYRPTVQQKQVLLYDRVIYKIKKILGFNS